MTSKVFAPNNFIHGIGVCLVSVMMLILSANAGIAFDKDCNDNFGGYESLEECNYKTTTAKDVFFFTFVLSGIGIIFGATFTFICFFKNAGKEDEEKK